jgi:hypothetical protein
MATPSQRPQKALPAVAERVPQRERWLDHARLLLEAAGPVMPVPVLVLLLVGMVVIWPAAILLGPRPSRATALIGLAGIALPPCGVLLGGPLR